MESKVLTLQQEVTHLTHHYRKYEEEARNYRQEAQKYVRELLEKEREVEGMR